MILTGESYSVESALRSLDSLLPANAGNGERELYVSEHRLVRNEVVALEDEADSVVTVHVPVSVLVGLGASAVDDEIAVGVAVQTAHDVEHGGLSTAGGAEDGNELTVTEGDVHALERVHRFRGGHVILFDVS